MEREKLSKLPTLKQLRKEFNDRVKRMGFCAIDSFDDVVGDLLWMCKQYEKAANDWMKAHDKLKAKYEPEVAVQE